MQDLNFDKNNIFSYNLNRKIKNFFYFLLTLIILLVFILYYIFFLQHSDNFIINFINSIFSNIYNNIINLTPLGAFYASFFGGLFFIISPMEIFFILFLDNFNPYILLIIYMIGIICSYTINYYIGMNLSEISKKIINIKRFYKFKSIINRYGVLAILFFNLLPLPSQPLAAVLGVFRYSKARFYIFFILGQFLKYSFIILGYFYIY